MSRNPPHNSSNGVTAQLNGGWRVVYDPQQWILQRRGGNNWNNRSYCVTREGLLRCVREYCDEVDSEALARLRALAEWHPDRTLEGTGKEGVEARGLFED
jgi:hypothetical protein